MEKYGEILMETGEEDNGIGGDFQPPLSSPS